MPWWHNSSRNLRLAGGISIGSATGNCSSGIRMRRDELWPASTEHCHCSLIVTHNRVWGGNVFSRVCLSFCSQGEGSPCYCSITGHIGLFPKAVQTCELPPPNSARLALYRHETFSSPMLNPLPRLPTYSKFFTMEPIHLSASERLTFDCNPFLFVSIISTSVDITPDWVRPYLHPRESEREFAN